MMQAPFRVSQGRTGRAAARGGALFFAGFRRPAPGTFFCNGVR
jgi:hypothetical protein